MNLTTEHKIGLLGLIVTLAMTVAMLLLPASDNSDFPLLVLSPLVIPLSLLTIVIFALREFFKARSRHEKDGSWLMRAIVNGLALAGYGGWIIVFFVIIFQ